MAARKSTGPRPAKKAAPAPVKAPETAEQPVDRPGARYAAFDRTFGRYIGGTRDTRTDAERIAEQIRAAGRVAEVREI